MGTSTSEGAQKHFAACAVLINTSTIRKSIHLLSTTRFASSAANTISKL